MKNLKLYISLALFFAVFSVSAQTPKPYKISQPLQLESVGISTSLTDSVLVWDSAKLVKFVPRSEFSGGSGSTPTLDQVIDAGNTIHQSRPIVFEYDWDDEDYGTKRSGGGLDYKGITFFEEYDNTEADCPQCPFYGASLSALDGLIVNKNAGSSNDDNITTTVSADGFFISRAGGGSVSLAPNWMGGYAGSNTLYFPDKSGTLLTDADIFLQKHESLNGYERELTFGDLLTTAGFFADEFTGSKFYMISQTGSEDLFREFGVKANDGVGSVYWVAGNSNSEIQFEEPLTDTGATKYVVPSPKSGDLNKTYTFAMTEDITLLRALQGGSVVSGFTNEVAIDNRDAEDGQNYTAKTIKLLATQTGVSPDVSQINMGNGAGVVVQSNKQIIISNDGVAPGIFIMEATPAGTTQLSFEDPISGVGTAHIKIPAKVDGNYVLATTDDVFLRKNPDGLNGYDRVLTPNEESDISLSVSFFADDTIGSTFDIQSSRGLDSENKTFKISAQDGVGKISWGANNAGGFIEFEEPLTSTGATKYVVPSAKLGDLDKTYTFAMTEDLEALKNEAGQVKVNYTGLSTTNFTANTTKTLDINAGTPTVVGSPTTTYPFSTPNSYSGIFDSGRGSTPTGRLIENPVSGQVHTWRFQVNYSNKGSGNNGSLDLILTNPVSGFQYVMPFTLPSGRTAGTLNNIAITIADGASIPSPNGYILQAQTSFTDTNLTVEVVSITRISNAVEVH